MKRGLSVSLMAAAVIAMSCTGIPDDTPDAPSGEITIPELPSDPDPGNTSFEHRILLIQHTGTYCPNCPALMESLKNLSEDKSYEGKYQHVASHSYNEEGDPAYSAAASNLSQAFCSGYYPELTFNLTKENTGTSLSVDAIRKCIDDLRSDVADAGISAAVLQTGDTLGVNVRIKVAKDNQYRIAAWLLEDNIKGRQEGAYEEWMNTHGNALRAMSGSTLNLRIYGTKVGGLKAGQTADMSFVIGVEEDWNVDNCKVLILVNASGKDGRYDLVNCAVCPVGGNVTYQYK